MVRDAKTGSGAPRRPKGGRWPTRTRASAPLGLVVLAALFVAFLFTYRMGNIRFGGQSRAAVVSVGVLSACANFDRRAAVRATWGKSDAFHSVDFFLGICKSNDLLERVIREHATHRDIVMAPKAEAYEHIVYQTMHMMSVLSHDDRVTHVFKTDDDCYVKPNRLLSKLDILSRDQTNENSLTGFVEEVSSPIRDPNNKWFASHDQWPSDRYPVWAHGAGYAVTARLARAIGSGIPHVINNGIVLPNEDVAVGAWIEYQSAVLGKEVRYHHDARFTFTGQCLDSDIVTHYVGTSELACLHRTGGACSRCFAGNRL